MEQIKKFSGIVTKIAKVAAMPLIIPLALLFSAKKEAGEAVKQSLTSVYTKMIVFQADNSEFATCLNLKNEDVSSDYTVGFWDDSTNTSENIALGNLKNCNTGKHIVFAQKTAISPAVKSAFLKHEIYPSEENNFQKFTAVAVSENDDGELDIWTINERKQIVHVTKEGK